MNRLINEKDFEEKFLLILIKYLSKSLHLEKLNNSRQIKSQRWSESQTFKNIYNEDKNKLSFNNKRQYLSDYLLDFSEREQRNARKAE